MSIYSFIENLGTVKVKMLLNQKPSWYEKDGKIEGIFKKKQIEL